MAHHYVSQRRLEGSKQMNTAAAITKKKSNNLFYHICDPVPKF